MALRILFLTLLCAAMAVSGQTQSSKGGGTIPSLEPVNAFGFNIVEHPDGTVTGKLTIRLLETDSFVKGSYQCIDVDGNFVTASGVIDEGHIFGDDLRGLCFVASAQDNGEGPNDPPDTVSFLTFGPCGTIVPDQACQEMPQPSILPIRGNIQAKP